MKKKFIIGSLILLFSLPAFGDKNSCSHYLRKQGRTLAVISASHWLIFPFLAPWTTYDARANFKKADQLKAAHILASRDHKKYNDLQFDNANAIIDKKYDKFLKLHPKTLALKKDFYEVLNDVYMTGVESGFCEDISQEISVVSNFTPTFLGIYQLIANFSYWEKKEEKLLIKRRELESPAREEQAKAKEAREIEEAARLRSDMEKGLFQI